MNNINSTSMIINRRNADGCSLPVVDNRPNRTVLNSQYNKKELPWWVFSRRFNYAPLTILETKDNKVTFPKYINFNNKKNEQIKAVSVKCNSRMCEVCGVKKGIETKKNIIEKKEKFREPRLFTLTINRNNFSYPEEAYKYVTENKFISRLFTKELGIKRWLWALEAQENEGDGWPHWHILIDVSDLEIKRYKGKYIPHFFDLDKAHRLLRKWGVAEQCYLSTKKSKKTGKKINFESSEHAINYICKYLTKMPKSGYPEWMLNTPRIRMIGASRQIGSLMAKTNKKSLPKDNEKKEISKRKPARKPIDKMQACGDEILFQKYDNYYDKNIIIGHCQADIAFLSNYEKTITYEINNHEKGIKYNVKGFENQDDLEIFLELTIQKEHLEKMEQKKQERRELILSRWNNRKQNNFNKKSVCTLANKCGDFFRI